MSDVFQEVDEEVRRERYVALSKRYAPYAIGLAVVIVVGVAAYIGWRDYQQTQRERNSAAFQTGLALLRDGNREQAAQTFADLAERAGGGYAALAELQRAAALAPKDPAAAVAAYDALAADSGADDLLRGVARLRAVLLLVDREDAAAVAARLEPLLGDQSPWRYQARELKALVDLRAGRLAEARAGFKGLVDAIDAPAGIRSRAAELLATLPEQQG